MKYYILTKDNLELQEITVTDYIRHVTKNEEDFSNSSLIIFNPAKSLVRSLDDISGYWFHDFGGELDESVHTSEEKALTFLEYISDFGRNSALYNYNSTINSGKTHTLAVHEPQEYSYSRSHGYTNNNISY